jgi:CRP-like cAMP-binding protein
MAASLLQDIYLFKEFSPKELEQLSEKGSSKTFNAGAEIFSQGDQAQSLFVIRSGTVKIGRESAGSAIELAQLGTGAHFGEMSFVDGEPRSASASATERTEVLEIGFDALRSYFDQNPTVAVKFFRSMSHFLAGRLRLTTMDLSFAREKNIRHF